MMIVNFEEWYQELKRIIVLTKNDLDEEYYRAHYDHYRGYYDQDYTPAQTWEWELLVAQEDLIATVAGESDEVS